ncbi:MAG: glycosyltransferase family protein [Acidimicrobiales bacterium]
MSYPRNLSRVLLYSHDTYGLGHLRRNLAIARRLLDSSGSTRVVLASGSPVLDRVARPPGLVCVQLPPVVKTGVDEYRSSDRSLSLSLVSRARSAVLSDIVARWQPDALLVDHAPQGMKGELLPVFDTVRLRSPETKVVLGLRDILDDPARVQATWKAEGTYEILESVYDGVVVYGDRDVFDLAPAYDIPEPLASCIEYCGYVTANRPQAPVRPAELTGDGRYLLGTVGGGGDGVEVLVATAHSAAARGLQSVLCTGPLMPATDRQILAEATKGIAGIAVVEHVADLAAVALGADCVVTRGGYNSLCELINLAVPTVVVPRMWPRREQLLRARAFAARGLVHVVEAPQEALIPAVTKAVSKAIGTPAGVRDELDCNGAQRVVRFLERTVKATRPIRLGSGHKVPARISA